MAGCARCQKLAATGKTLGIIKGNRVISLLKRQNPTVPFMDQLWPNPKVQQRLTRPR